MGLDLRIPVGVMFALTGLILAGFGLATYHSHQLYAQSLGININLWWGFVLLAFGVAMAGLGLRGQMKEGGEDAQTEVRKRNEAEK